MKLARRAGLSSQLVELASSCKRGISEVQRQFQQLSWHLSALIIMLLAFELEVKKLFSKLQAARTTFSLVTVIAGVFLVPDSAATT